MSLESLTQKVYFGKSKGWKTIPIHEQLTRNEQALGIILYAVRFGNGHPTWKYFERWNKRSTTNSNHKDVIKHTFSCLYSPEWSQRPWTLQELRENYLSIDLAIRNHALTAILEVCRYSVVDVNKLLRIDEIEEGPRVTTSDTSPTQQTGLHSPAEQSTSTHVNVPSQSSTTSRTKRPSSEDVHGQGPSRTRQRSSQEESDMPGTSGRTEQRNETETDQVSIVCGLCDSVTDPLVKMRLDGAKTLVSQLTALGKTDRAEYVQQKLDEKTLHVHQTCRVEVKNSHQKLVTGEAKLSTQPRRSSKRKKGFVKSSESKEEKSAVSTTVLPYKHRCIICLKHIIIEYKKGQLDTAGTHADCKSKHRAITTLEMKQTLMNLCLAKADDPTAMEVYGRLQGLNDLVSEEAMYCVSCFVALGKPVRSNKAGKPKDLRKEHSFNLLCEWMDERAEHGLFTLGSLHSKLEFLVKENDEVEDCYSRKYLKSKLLDRYRDTIYFTNEEKRADVLCFKDRCNQILRDYSKNEFQSLEDQKKELLTAAAKILINDIKTISINKKVYPTVAEMSDEYEVPNSLTYFLSALIGSKKCVNAWAQNIISTLRPRSGPMPLQLGLALMMDHKFGSKHLIQLLNKLGYCSPYAEVLRYKWSYLKNRHESQLEVIPEDSAGELEETGDQFESLSSDDDDNDEEGSIENDGKDSDDETASNFSDNDSEISFEVQENVATVEVLEEVKQMIGDNLDLSLTSVYGNTSYHAMGRMEVTTPKPDEFTEPVIERKDLKPNEKAALLQDLTIKLHPYQPLRANGLSSVSFRPINKLQRKFCYDTSCLADTAFYANWIIHVKNGNTESPPVNWKGLMKSFHRQHAKERSHIEFLQIIDHPPDSYSTVYTTLIECLKITSSNPMIITFDLPLWLKATRIVLEKGMPIIVRLGGFHTLKSFLGCIGHIMTDSGIEDLIRLIYPGDVEHIMDGGSYYKALRSHFLIDAALCTFVLEDEITDEDLADMKSYIAKCSQEKLGINYKSRAVQDVSAIIKEKFKALSSNSRTAALWVTYHKLISLVKDFIRSERLHDFELHLATVAQMLPIFAAAGRGQYAKGLRLYLELMASHETKYPAVMKTFKVVGLHTVRYTDHEWSGVWTDLSIEQRFMKASKIPGGGMKGGRMRNQNTTSKMWPVAFNQMAKINESIDGTISSWSNKKKASKAALHPDLTKSAVRKNVEKFDKLLNWFKENADFQQSDDKTKLVSYSTGLIAETGKDDVNPDECFTVGTTLQQELDGLSFTNKIRVKGKVKNLSQLKKKVTVNDKEVAIDSQILFDRLIFAADRDSTLKDSLAFELTVLPMSLFNNKQMLRKGNKAALGKYLKNVSTSSKVEGRGNPNMPLIIDGGWLLHQITSYAGCDTYGDVANLYLKLLLPRYESREVVVVFDGYRRSTKDHEHQRRLKTYCADISIKSNTVCTIPMKRLLANSNNKIELIKLLCNVFTQNGIEVDVADDDADTMVVAKALNQSLLGKVEVKAEDTDILCLLVHHVREQNHEIIINTGSGLYSITEIAHALDPTLKEMLLFIHSFSGCDTVSSIFGFGKEVMLKKAAAINEEVDLSPLLSVRETKSNIIDAGILLFQHLYNGNSKETLESLRFLNYSRMIAKKKKLNPGRLPPTTAAATEHVLRAYLQYHNWITLKFACNHLKFVAICALRNCILVC